MGVGGAASRFGSTAGRSRLEQARAAALAPPKREPDATPEAKAAAAAVAKPKEPAPAAASLGHKDKKGAEKGAKAKAKVKAEEAQPAPVAPTAGEGAKDSLVPGLMSGIVETLRKIRVLMRDDRPKDDRLSVFKGHLVEVGDYIAAKLAGVGENGHGRGLALGPFVRSFRSSSRSALSLLPRFCRG